MGEGSRGSYPPRRILGHPLAGGRLSRLWKTRILGDTTKHPRRLDRHGCMHEQAGRDQGCLRQATPSMRVCRRLSTYPRILDGRLGSARLQTIASRLYRQGKYGKTMVELKFADEHRLQGLHAPRIRYPSYRSLGCGHQRYAGTRLASIV